jgi:hypothetical protein
MKKKYIFMPLMSLLLLTMVSLKSHANEFLTLTGQVKEIDIIEEDTKTIKLKIGLDLTLKNISESNIIVYKSDFALLNLTLFTLDENGKKIHLYSAGGRASNYDSPETRILQKQLNQKIPPSDLTYVIKVGDSFNFSTETECVFLKSKISASANESWNAISKSSPILIELKLEIFPSYLKQSNSKSFSEKALQDRWKKYGYLWLDDIVSEPIPLDLSSAMIKTDSQP